MADALRGLLREPSRCSSSNWKWQPLAAAMRVLRPPRGSEAACAGGLAGLRTPRRPCSGAVRIRRWSACGALQRKA